ncbi:hypothetical protein BJX62DRAFT_228504 [Aspergillus germanicus]
MFVKAFVAILAFWAPSCPARASPCLIPTTSHTTADLLATGFDVPELWLITPGANNSAGSGRSLYTFSNASSLLGIAHVGRDTYLVVAGDVSLSTFTAAPSSFAIWTIDLAHHSAPLARPTSAYRKRPPNTLPVSSSETKIGVNGLKVQRGYVYFTGTSKGIYGRIPINADAVQTGPMEILASGFTLDDFYLASDGSAYLATNSENRLFWVSSSGRVQLVVGGLNELTVAGLTSVARSRDGRTLYVTTNGGMSSPVPCSLVEPAKIVAVRI